MYAIYNTVLSSVSFKYLSKLFLSLLQRFYEDSIFLNTEEELSDSCWRGNRMYHVCSESALCKAQLLKT